MKRKHAVIPILVFLVTAGCATPRSEPTVSPVPTTIAAPTETASPSLSGTTTTQFLIGQLGEKYFREHFMLVTEEAVSSGLVKALYRYTYEPYIKDFGFTLLFDRKKQGLSDEEVSVVLLEPQAFKLSPEEAIKAALAQGLEPTTKSYSVELTFGRMTRNRFAWAVTSPEAKVGKIHRIVLDVEGGDVYAKDVLGVDKSH